MNRRTPIAAVVLVQMACGSASCGGSGGDLLAAASDGGFKPPPPEVVPLPYDGGPAIRGHVGPTGGSVSRLHFAVVGDTRPAAQDDTSGYPSGVISKIYAEIEALSPRPTFAISTGDYQFSSPRGTQALPQIDLYLAARSLYAGALFPAMGNHECTGATASNCGPGSVDGITNNYRAFQTGLLTPIGKDLPYYEVSIDADDGSWTSKLLVVAANAWAPAQAAWLQRAMGRSTTYTFVVRHEGPGVTAAPGVVPSERILQAYPYTLAIFGHRHSYDHPKRREIIVGNGGAPLTGNKSYGFAVVSQQADGSLAVDMVDYVTGQADPTFHFVL